ncbi:MAG: SRPBCC family protein [Rhizobiales bacterium]|nr:SRPBCC family protein [Hyphomicrobiales bacterium]
MPTFRSERRVRHAAADMFDLVADCESYPQFVPLCTGMRVWSRKPAGEGVETMMAEMSVGYKAIRETFTTRATFDRPKMKILVEYVDGPFSRLENRWTFRDLPDAGGRPQSLVEFYIAYEFRSRMLALVMGSMFDAAFRKFAAAFEKRADEIYGKRDAS